MEGLSEEVFRRKAAGETDGEIAESYGSRLRQIQKLITRQNNKAQEIADSCIPRPKNLADEEHGETMNGWSCICRWSCCEIFCPKLGEGEAEVSR